MKTIGAIHCGARKRAITHSLLAGLAASTAVLCGVPARADNNDTTVETVVVTAEKRSENIQNVPMSVSAVSGDQLEHLGVTDIQTLAPFLPNFAVNNVQKNRNTAVEIRNFQSGGSNPGIEGDVGVYIDGLYAPAGGGVSLASLVDIADVEVLRGPQGTLYGRNTVAGALVVTTRAPSQTPEAMFDGTFGNYGYDRFQGYFGGGITDDLAGRVILFGSSGNDWEHDITTGNWVGGTSDYGGRFRLAYTPSDNLTVNVIASYDRIHSTFGDWVISPVSASGPYSVLTPNFLSSQAAVGKPFQVPNFNEREVTTLGTPDDATQIAETEVQADYVTPFDATVTSISGYNVYVNSDVSPVGSFANDEGTQLQALNMTSYSEELRVASTTGGFLEYLAGVYGYYQDTSYVNYSTFGPGANLLTAAGKPKFPAGTGSGKTSGQKTLSGAVFGQVKITPFDHFHIIGGFRYSSTSKQGRILGYTINLAPNNTDTGRMTYSKGVSTWLATAQYDISDNAMAYATASTGFKDGGFNLANATKGTPAFDPETSFNYEIGAKTTLFDGKLVFDADVFFMKIKSYQQSTWDGALTPPGFIVGNAGNLTSKGYEATISARPIDPLSIQGSIGLTDEKISAYSAGTCPAFQGPPIQIVNTGPATGPTPAGTCNYNGLTPSFAPRMRWSLGATWEQPLTMFQGWNWLVESDFSWTGSQFLDPTLDVPSYQGPTKILNARLGVESDSGRWRLMLWGKNLTDQLYYVFATNMVTEGNMQGATPTTTPNGYSNLYAPPRTFGIEGTYKF